MGSEMCIRDRPGSCRARPVNVDDGLGRYQVDPWSRGRQVARGVLRSFPKPEKRSILCHRRGIDIFVACFLHSSAQMCFYPTPGRRPPLITGRFVNPATIGWVEAPNESAPFRFQGAVVRFVDRCLSRTRNLAASTYLMPIFFVFFFSSLHLFL